MFLWIIKSSEKENVMKKCILLLETVLILIDEFNKQYQELRFGETNNVIKHFRHELDSIGKELKISEDSLTKYRVEKQVINNDEETKHVAALNRDYELQYWETLNNYIQLIV